MQEHQHLEGGGIMKAKCSVRVGLIVLIMALLYAPMAIAGQPHRASPPIQVVVVSGTNYEMGVQYGEQAANLIAANRDATWNLLDTQVVAYPDGPPLEHEVILKDIQVWTYYLEQYDPKLKDWLLGISHGCRNKGVAVSYLDLVAIMVLPQELWARPAGPYPAETGVAPIAINNGEPIFPKDRTDTRAMASCTAFAATGEATTDGEPMVSLTLGFIAEIKQYVILFAYPDEGEPFVALTIAGKVSNNTGMNRDFAWVMTAAVTHPMTDCASSWGVTSEVYHHYLQQYCRSPQEAMAYLDATPSGGVTGIFLFADDDSADGDEIGDVFAYEVGTCASATRYPGDLGETGFVATTNNYNSDEMTPYAIPMEWFADTYIRYATITKKLADAQSGTIGLDFAKACWLSNQWWDETIDDWQTVPVPNDPNDPNTCNVPGNNCEGGESQVVQFPAQKTVYLEPGGPHGTTIAYYWPDDPKPTGEYTKWQLGDTIEKTAGNASDDTLQMLTSASDALRHRARFLERKNKKSLQRLLAKAWKAWRNAEAIVHAHNGRHPWENVASRGYGRPASFSGPHGCRRPMKMALWGSAYTSYATAQLYSQMVTTQLNRLAD